MRPRSGPWGLVAGIALGFVIGSVSVATATFGYKGWQRFSSDFSLGYLAGFFDMANLARNLDPAGFVDEHYPVWPNVKVLEWHQTITELYKDPKNQEFGMYTMVQLAAAELKKKYGPAPTALERLAPRFSEQIARARKAEEAKRAAPKGAKPAAPTVAGAQGASGTPPKPAVAPRPSPWGHKKRRCPCPDEPKDSASQEKPGEKDAAAAPAAEPAKAEAAKQRSGEAAAPSPSGKAAGDSPSKP